MLSKLLYVALAIVALLPLAAARVHLSDAAQTTIDASNVDAAFQQMAAQIQWTQFKSKFKRVYESREIEENRFQIFQDNLARAAELNKKNPTAQFGVNKFSDLHPIEFRRTYLNFVPAVGDAAVLRQAAPVRRAAANSSLPTNFDWRKPDHGVVAVTAVKDQGQCGSCWAFSATEAVESSWIMAGKDAVVLAPQQTVDCDTVDQGCGGGDTVTAYAYMKKAGVETESAYPYFSGGSGNAGNCDYKESDVAARISGFVYATPGCTDSCTNQNEAELKQNLYDNGPVSICVDASVWQSYTGGVLTASSGCSSDYSNLDHCVQLTGWGDDVPSKQKFWSVRNSWNTDWGEAGYIRLLYGQNTCGVADEATQATPAV